MPRRSTPPARSTSSRASRATHGPAFYGLPRNAGTVTLREADRGRCPKRAVRRRRAEAACAAARRWPGGWSADFPAQKKRLRRAARCRGSGSVTASSACRRRCPSRRPRGLARLVGGLRLGLALGTGRGRCAGLASTSRRFMPAASPAGLRLPEALSILVVALRSARVLSDLVEGCGVWRPGFAGGRLGGALGLRP